MEALVPTELCALRGSLAYTIRSQPFDHILTPLHLHVCIRFVQCALAVCIKASRAGILCASRRCDKSLIRSCQSSMSVLREYQHRTKKFSFAGYRHDPTTGAYREVPQGLTMDTSFRPDRP